MIVRADADKKYQQNDDQEVPYEEKSNNYQKNSSSFTEKNRKRLCSSSCITPDDIIHENQQAKIINEDDGSSSRELDYCNDESLINLLNDDCLFNIFSYLPILDLIRIERVCKRWKRISLESWREVKILSVHKDFKTRSLQLNHFEEILRRSGNYMTSFDCSWLNKSTHLHADDAVKLINKYCKKLNYLNICYTFKTKKSYLNSLDVNILKNLKLLAIGNYECNDDYLSDVLHNCVNLEEFNVAGYVFAKNVLMYLTEKCTTLAVTYSRTFSDGMLSDVLKKYQNIQNLDISGTGIVPYTLLPFTNQFKCLALWQMENFFEVDISNFKSLTCPHLRVLDIRFNDFTLTGEILSVLIENCPNVEDLRLERSKMLKDEHFNVLKKLKNLMYLDVSFTKISNRTLIGLSETFRKLKKLECYGCNNINSTGLNKVIDVSPELTELSISKSMLTKPLIKSALASLQKRNNKIDLTICLSAKNDKILAAKIPDLIKKLGLKSEDYKYSSTSAMRIVYGSSKCNCNFEKTCFCLLGLDTMAYFG